MSWIIYLKTTETCNLNCSHCFTSGKTGRRIFFDPIKTSNWVNALADYDQSRTIHIDFHGGEPLLAPLPDLVRFRDIVQHHCGDRVSFGITTNLVYKLTPNIMEFFDTLTGRRVSTSWDPTIRFSNKKQLDLWENNVKHLINQGITVKLFVSISRDVVNLDPAIILEYVTKLGISEIDFERITHDGNAKRNPEIFPSNATIDQWILDLHNATTAGNYRDKITNHFLESVYDKFERNYTKSGTFCRNCEQHIFTINADGTIAGCPNTAPTSHFSDIKYPINDVLQTPKRLDNIVCEANVNVACLKCPVHKYCGGDCYQLQWEDDICPAPKKLMLSLSGK